MTYVGGTRDELPRVRARDAEPVPHAPVAGSAAHLLALQRSAGNQAVARALLQRETPTAEEAQVGVSAESTALIEAARDRIGKMSWGKLAIDKALAAADTAGDTADEATSVNCWDGVLVIALRAGQITVEDLRAVYAISDHERKEAFVTGAQGREFERMKEGGAAEAGSRPTLNEITAASVIANRAVRDFLVGSNPRRIADPLAPDQLAPGEVVLIEEELGDLSHVALATGTNDVAHLWTLNLTGRGGLEEVTLPDLVRGYIEQKLPAYMGQDAGNTLDKGYVDAYRATEFGFLKAVQTRVATGRSGLRADTDFESLQWSMKLDGVLDTYRAVASTPAYEEVSALWKAGGDPKALLDSLEQAVAGALPEARRQPATADVFAPYLGTLKVSAALPDWEEARRRAEQAQPPAPEPAAEEPPLRPKEERSWLRRALYAASRPLPDDVRKKLKRALFGR